jgi:phosphatidylglycerol:prolipoprotein diacylglycerol transferase
VTVGVVAMARLGYANRASVHSQFNPESDSMQQVLFRPSWLFESANGQWYDLPIYGYGAMLFLAFFFCTWMAARLAKMQGIPLTWQNMQDVCIWLFVCGIAAARITFMIQYGVRPDEFYKIWEGGLVFYGSAIGGVVGYFGAYYFILRKYNISTWKMADIIAPCGALGLALGRLGCLLNGCCFGNVACPDCPHISFKLPTDPRIKMVERGYQTAAGFTMSSDPNDHLRDKRVDKVEPGSEAYRAGLRDGDVILKVNDKSNVDPYYAVGSPKEWERGKNDLALEVRHLNGNVEDIDFQPWTIGLHPTQLYETTSMMLLFMLMVAYMPFRRHDGEVMVLFMLGYAVHRFLNEMLRTDTDRVAFDMTLSQNVSILVFVGGLVLALIIWVTQPRVPLEEKRGMA